MGGGSGQPRGWDTPITAESVANTARMAEALEHAALHEDGAVPAAWREDASRTGREARRDRELLELTAALSVDDQELMTFQLLVLSAGVMRHRA